MLLLSVCSLLSAQSLREAKIHIEPVTGSGGSEDNSYFFKQLEYEVVFQKYLLSRTRRTSDFILRGTTGPFTGHENMMAAELAVETTNTGTGAVPSRPIPPIRNTSGRQEYFSIDSGNSPVFIDTSGRDTRSSNTSNQPRQQIPNGEWFFLVELINRETDEVIGMQYIVYQTVDSAVGDLLPILVYNLLSGIPEIEEMEDWREQWIFVDFGFIWAPRINYSESGAINLLNLGVGVSLEFHFLKFLALNLGVQVVQETSGGESNRDLILEAPIALKFVFKPFSNIILQPYGGILFNYSLMNKTEPSMFSYFAGLELGFRTGSGIFIINPRYAIDVESSHIGSGMYIHRHMVQISLGYKIGFGGNSKQQLDY